MTSIRTLLLFKNNENNERKLFTNDYTRRSYYSASSSCQAMEKKTVRILPLAGGFVVRPEKEFDWKEIEIKFRRVGKKISNSLLSEAISAAKKTIYADSR